MLDLMWSRQCLELAGEKEERFAVCGTLVSIYSQCQGPRSSHSSLAEGLAVSMLACRTCVQRNWLRRESPGSQTRIWSLAKHNTAEDKDPKVLRRRYCLKHVEARIGSTCSQSGGFQILRSVVSRSFQTWFLNFRSGAPKSPKHKAELIINQPLCSRALLRSVDTLIPNHESSP